MINKEGRNYKDSKEAERGGGRERGRKYGTGQRESQRVTNPFLTVVNRFKNRTPGIFSQE